MSLNSSVPRATGTPPSDGVDPTEEWRPIPGWGHIYQVSNLGRVRSRDRLINGPRGPRRVRGVVLRAHPQNKGYLTVHLHDAPRTRSRTVHTLVAEAFIGPRPGRLMVRHEDGNQLNNRAGNLAYGTGRENNQDIVRHGRNPNANKTHCNYGHPLVAPNLAKPGGNMEEHHRKCLACNRGRVQAWRQGVKLGTDEFRAILDAYYVDIVGDDVNAVAA